MGYMSVHILGWYTVLQKILTTWVRQTCLLMCLRLLQAVSLKVLNGVSHLSFFLLLVNIYPTERAIICQQKFKTTWAVMSENLPLDMCSQWRFRSVCTFMQLGAFCIAKDAKFLHVDNENSDQIAWMHRLIQVFVVHTSECTLCSLHMYLP